MIFKEKITHTLLLDSTALSLLSTIRAARDLVETHFLSEIITMVKYCEFSEAGALFY
jgi:hypothetical protein